MKVFEPSEIEQGFGSGLQEFQQLVSRRIRDVLLVSSLFDFYLFEEEGLLYEQILSEYHGLQLSHSPEFTRVSSGAEAFERLERGERFDLVITTLHIEDMTPLRLARGIRERLATVPIVLLAYDKRELNDLVAHKEISAFDRTFVWQGDFRLLIAIIKNIEDELNAPEDTSRFGVQCIMLIEDSVRYASYFLPLLYSEVISHSYRLIAEGVNASHRSLRMRARPKILLCSSWEHAEQLFDTYQEHIIGIISDAGFPRGGEVQPRAGIDFARMVKERYFDIPVLLQSTDASLEAEARSVGALFLTKSSPTLVDDVRDILRDYFSFGDFIFRTPDGTEVGRATDLKSLEAQLASVPDESILYHASRNHFSIWLKARTEFRLALRLRPRKVTDYPDIAALRADLIRQLHEHRSVRQRGLLTEFSKDTFDPSSSFARIGGGSVGGKARGIAFLNALLASHNVRSRFEGLEIEVPPAIVIGTDVFDRFIEVNDLRWSALEKLSDEEIFDRFVNARFFPDDIAHVLQSFIELCPVPLAVRSSSLLEDSQFHPFAGVYQTYMIPNNSDDPSRRLRELIVAIKRVYASTFYRSAREYIKVTSLRLEDEKMAVIVQKMVGAKHDGRFYPDISGVSRSYNFYPVGPQKPEDGTASVALGLGKTIVEGGASVRFCPRYPDHTQQFFSPRQGRRQYQRDFYALDLGNHEVRSILDEHVVSYELADAEADGTLQSVVSTYSAENDALYEGMARPGIRVITFAPILRNRIIPLASAIDFVSGLGSWGIGAPVELEFAVTLASGAETKNKLGLLQMRPLVLSRETEDLAIDDAPSDQVVCQSSHVLGHGAIRDLRDIVVVNVGSFDRLKSYEVACEVARLNEQLVNEHRDYLLIGPGRWGSMDPLLGIPVKWEQICGAKAIVESGFRDMAVDPSQGTHFFQNLTAFQVGYFTVSPRLRNSFVDWDWLAAQKPVEEGPFVRHLRLADGVVVKMNGHQRRGVILKPA